MIGRTAARAVSRQQQPPFIKNHTMLRGNPGEEAEHGASSAEGSPLLRTWRSPPLAPAVAVHDDDDVDVSASRFSYPVATFVRELVRTSMDHMQEMNAVSLTSRSEGQLPTITGREPPQEGAYSARTVNDIDDDAEFILVDGEMIPVPVANAAEQEGLEENLRDQVRSCQPKKLRRGVRKFNKFFAKLGRKNKDGSASDNGSITTGASEEFLTARTATSTTPACERVNLGLLPALTGMGAAAAAAAGEPPTTTMTQQDESSPSRRGRAKHNKRRNWRRHDDNHVNQDGAATAAVTNAAEISIPVVQIRAFTTPSATAALQPAVTGISPRPFSPDDSGHQRTQSAQASYMGTTDDLLEAGVLPAGIAAEAYVEFDEPNKKDDAIVPSLVPRDAFEKDLKVANENAPDVETMLRRAAWEARTDLEEDAPTPARRRLPASKSDGSSVPLSLSSPGDKSVHNDMLKVVMAGSLLEKSWLARAMRSSTKRPRKRANLAVDVYTWTTATNPAVKCSIWDTQGATTVHGSPNFGGHRATQSLFFSPQSLYVLVWDLSATNLKTFRTPVFDEYDCDSDSEDGFEDDFEREERNRQADRALEADIQSQLLTWVDCIAQRGANSVVLPVAVIPEGMEPDEVDRRCKFALSFVDSHITKLARQQKGSLKLFQGNDGGFLTVTYQEGGGADKVREAIEAIATSAFPHVGTPVPEGTVLVHDIIQRFRQDHKVVLLDHVLGEVGLKLTVEQVLASLRFLANVGEILYFGTEEDNVLSRFIILSRKWLISALSCVLRNDLKRELEETRSFMNMQCLYGASEFPENEVMTALTGNDTSSCPLLSDSDARMLWQSMSFMREAADRFDQTSSDGPTTAPTMYYFLETLLVHMGILLPLETSSVSLDHSKVFFVPSLLAEVDPQDVWNYRCREGWMTTVCHSWLFRDGAPSDLMERISVSILGDLFEFSRTFKTGVEQSPMSRAKTVPIARPSLHAFYDDHNDEAIGRLRVHQLMCWQSSVLVKIGSIVVDSDTNELRESFVEILVTIVDQSSNLCVASASDVMRPGTHRVIVSAKGEAGHHGKRIYEGGYQAILDSLRKTLQSCENVDFQVVCPQCLAHSTPHTASTWSWESVRAVAESGCSVIRCMRGHRVNSNLVGVPCRESLKAPPDYVDHETKSSKSVQEILPSVVLVGLWDCRSQCLRNVGSGFVANRKLGLIVTAGHVLFDMNKDDRFGAKYGGLREGKVVIGVVGEDGHTAVFRYFADIVADDIHNVDACVVRIRTRLEHDVADEGEGIKGMPENILDQAALPNEDLRSLKLATRFELDDPVRILGFNQGGDGVFERGKHVNRSADFAKGYICMRFRANLSDDSSSDSTDSSSQFFSPREEIVVMCPTISGHSGGPCVNSEGKVVGILSRSDPVQRQRCYLVPASELKILLNDAKKACTQRSPNVSISSMR